MPTEGAGSPCRNIVSGNFSAETIPVEFLVLHYTACNLEKTLEIFCSREKQVCAHFVIDTDGTICDLGGFWDGPIRRGAHAGVSHFTLAGQLWEGFNKFSIGIELVNFNGNLFAYPEAQYEALISLARHLVQRFPGLEDPRRVVGHEHIAGFRGKVDPGIRFDWKKFFSRVYPGQPMPERSPVLDQAMLTRFESLHGKVDSERLGPEDWARLSSQLEGFVALEKGRA